MKEENSASTLLHSSGALAPDSRQLRPSEDGSPRSVRLIPPHRELDAPIGEAKSNRWGGQLRVDALLEMLPWQVRAITLITLIGPPTASLVLLAVDYFEYWRGVPFNLAEFLIAYFLFAIPVGYVFGAVPALLAASLYCALLTANSGLMQRPRLTRACVAAICGGLASGLWFWELLHTAWGIYALVGALVMAALSLARTQPAPSLEKGMEQLARAPNQGASPARWARDRLGRQARFIPRPEGLGRGEPSEEMKGSGPRGAIRQQEAHRVP